MACVIWWIRRDLRLSDNQALQAALGSGQPVIPLFVLDPHRLQHPAPQRHGFLYTGLRQLDVDLRRRGSRLIVRQGNAEQALSLLAAQTQASAVFAEESASPHGRACDADVAATLPLHLLPGLTTHRPTAVLKADGAPYTVFTPFMHAWKRLPLPDESDLLPAPPILPGVPPDLMSDELPDAIAPDAFPPGEPEAQHRLDAFCTAGAGAIFRYASGRDQPGIAGTSELSPYFRFGMVSARQAAVAALTAQQMAGNDVARRGAETWLNELIWREFYQSILFHFPGVLKEAFRPALRAVAWSNSPDDFAAWCQGQTGYPIVDAAMRQLVQTGWMHNRARMVAASFLVKDLLIDWQWGERFFMLHLVDGEAAANNGGWQWTAGVGTDAAPYFRIFNPALQGKRFDPAGDYVRRWLPELANVPSKYIHTPWDMLVDVQSRAGCIIGRDYPGPIIDHSLARQRALAVYGAAQGRSV